MFHLRYDHQTGERYQHQAACAAYSSICVLHYGVYAFDLSAEDLSSTGSNQAYRTISTSQLNALLRLHLWPIDVVVFHGPQGDLVLKGASRLDAFSGYPFRS